MSTPRIQVSNLSKRYRLWRTPEARAKAVVMRWLGQKNPPPHDYSDISAVTDASFSLGEGESVGIIGLNGSGKSTLLQMIAGTLHPSKGTISTNGRIAALLELGAGFNPDFTGRENVFLNASILGLSQSEIEAKLPAIEAYADLGEFIDHPIKTYSSGMYVRLGFAVLTQVEPEILIIDEALAVGDFLFQQKCFDTMKRFKETGATFLFVSHSMGMVLELCSRAIVMERGRVIFDGPAPEAVALYEETAVRQRYGAKAEGRLIEGITSQRNGGAERARPPSYDLSPNINPAVVAKEPGAIYSAEAELIFARTLNHEFLEKVLFRTQEDIIVSLGFRPAKPLREPHIGFKVRDKMGRVLFETSSLCMREYPAEIGAGETIVGNFRFRNTLAPGEYNLVVGFAEGTVGDRDYREALTYVQNVASFTVVSAPADILWSGITHLDPDFGWSIIPPASHD